MRKAHKKTAVGFPKQRLWRLGRVSGPSCKDDGDDDGDDDDDDDDDDGTTAAIRPRASLGSFIPDAKMEARYP